MTLFISEFLKFVVLLFGLLDNKLIFEFNGVAISFLQISLIFTIFAIIASVFWKGGRA